MSSPAERFSREGMSPSFSLEGFLLPSARTSTPGFDEWNIFEVPDSCLIYTQFHGRYIPEENRDANQEEIYHVSSNRPVTAPGAGVSKTGFRPVTQTKSNYCTIDPPQVFHPPERQRPRLGPSSPASARKEQRLKALTKCHLDSGPIPSQISSNRSAFKGRKFNVNKADVSAAEINDSQLKSYDLEYDLRGLSRQSVLSGDASDVLPVLTKPLQIHNRVMGWKLTSDRGSVTAMGKHSARRVHAPVTLKSLGFMDSESDVILDADLRDTATRVQSRQLTALEKLIRRNEAHRAKEEIARKASRSACRNQNLDVIVQPKMSPASGSASQPGSLLRASEGFKTKLRKPAVQHSSVRVNNLDLHVQNMLLSQYTFGGALTTSNSLGVLCNRELLAPETAPPAPPTRPPDDLGGADGDRARPAVSPHGENTSKPTLLDILKPLQSLQPSIPDDAGVDELYLREIRLRTRNKLL